ncbi:F0F1 ATP synthase subunit delta, partial [bacterium AH-315-K03]|nr:F0F1 ATP synthase subunit delta [bacterium AH-315-K03]
SKQLTVAAGVAQTEKMLMVLTSPSLTSGQQAQHFIDVCGEELNGKAQNFVKILAENKRLALLPHIVVLYDEFKANREKSVEVEVTTAFEIDANLQDKLAKALSSKLDRDVKLQSIIDKNLIGGAVIRAADVVIDNSVRGRLAKLAEAMNA